MRKIFNMSRNFVKGYSRVLDLFSATHEYAPPKTPEDDCKAMRSDWNNVGMDLRKALNHYGKIDGL